MQFWRDRGEVARELGVRRNELYKWDEQFKSKGTDEVFPGPGRRVGAAAEIVRLQRENARLQEDNEILKKAGRYFARAPASSPSSSRPTTARTGFGQCAGCLQVFDE